MVISHFTSIISSTGALRSSSSTSSFSDCSSSPFGSCVERGSATGGGCVVHNGNQYHHHYWQQNLHYKFLSLHFFLCILSLFYISPPVTAESGGWAFIKSLLSGSSSGTAVNCAFSTLKCHLRFKTVCWRYFICLWSPTVWIPRTDLGVKLMDSFGEDSAGEHTRNLFSQETCMNFLWFFF